jgi:hypothetical protein
MRIQPSQVSPVQQHAAPKPKPALKHAGAGPAATVQISPAAQHAAAKVDSDGDHDGK